jgi:hypothetical protein
MRNAAKAPLSPAPQHAGRNPITCVLMTAAIAVTFWFGMVWLAQRLIG